MFHVHRACAPRHRAAHGPRRPSLLALLAGVVGALLAPWPEPAAAQAAPVAEPVFDIDIPAQPLAQALAALSRQTGVQVFAAGDLVSGRQAPTVQGRLGARHVLDRLLAGSDLTAVAEGGSIIVKQASSAAATEPLLPAVTARAGVEPGDLPRPFVGGQVARGGSLGLLGNQDYLETPFSISSFTEQTIIDSQARRITDVVRLDPAVRPLLSQNAQNDQYYLRGFLAFNSDIGVNGLYGLGGTRVSPVEAFERVEVIKGPSALLTGIAPGGGVGGSINLVTKRADDEPLTRVGVRYIADARLGGNVDIGRRFGTDKAFGVRANLAYTGGETTLDEQKVKNFLGSLALDYRGERLRIGLDLIRHKPEIDGGSHQLVGFTDPQQPPDPRRRFNLASDHERITSTTAIGRIDYQLGDQAALSLSYGRLDSEEIAHESSTSAADPAAGTQTFGQYTGVNHTVSQVADFALRFALKTGDVSHKLSFGASRYTSALDYNAGPGPDVTRGFGDYSALADPFRPDFEFLPYSESTNTGFAIADTLGFAEDRLLLTLGARHQRVVVDQYEYPLFGLSASRYDESATSPAVGALFKATTWLSVYGNVIQGLTPAPAAPLDALTLVNPGQVFPPYESKQIEVGAKTDFGNFGVTAALFQITQPNAVVTSTADPARGRYAFDGEQRNRGLELSAFGAPARGVRLLGGLTFIAAALTKTQDGANDGNTAAGVPKRVLTLNGEWDLPALTGLTLTSGLTAASKQFTSDANTVSIPGYGVLSLGVRYALRMPQPLVLRASMENVADKDYFSSAARGFGTVGAARTVLLSATVDF